MSYRDFLLKVAKVDPGVIPFYQTRTNGEWGAGIDAEPALDSLPETRDDQAVDSVTEG